MKKRFFLPIFLGLILGTFGSAQEAHQSLVPFNQLIFNDYCQHQVDMCENRSNQVTQMLLWGTVATGFSCYGLYTFPGKFNSLWRGFSESQGAVGTTCSAGWALAVTTYSLYNLTSLPSKIVACLKSWKSYLDNPSQYEKEKEKWELRLCATPQEQLEWWNELVYSKFGKAIVTGSYEAGQSYYLEGDKTYGAGRMTFDPCNEDDVRILLGIHATKKDNCFCKELCIVVMS